MKTLFLAVFLIFSLPAPAQETDSSVEELIPEEFPPEEYEKRYVEDTSPESENPLIEAAAGSEGKKLLRDDFSADLVGDMEELEAAETAESTEAFSAFEELTSF